jgi:hypothetical protein
MKRLEIELEPRKHIGVSFRKYNHWGLELVSSVYIDTPYTVVIKLFELESTRLTPRGVENISQTSKHFHI